MTLSAPRRDAPFPPRIVDKLKENISYLQDLIAEMSDALTDEGAAWTVEGLERLRQKAANALAPEKRPDWLHHYADPPLTAGLSAARQARDEQGNGK